MSSERKTVLGCNAIEDLRVLAVLHQLPTSCVEGCNCNNKRVGIFRRKSGQLE